MTSKGEYRVGIDFNPSGQDDVAAFKGAVAALIDSMQAFSDKSDNPEVKRLCALSQTELESAAMWGVKALTKKPQAG